MSALKTLAAGLLCVGLLVSCGDSDESSEAPSATTTTSETNTTTTTSATPTTVEDLEPLTYQYDAKAAPRFVGLQLGHVTFADPDGDPESEGWYRPWGPWPADESEGWTLMLARRLPPPPTRLVAGTLS